jgi:hypothetical protein
VTAVVVAIALAAAVTAPTGSSAGEAPRDRSAMDARALLAGADRTARAVLRSSLETAEADLVTTRGSANDAMWTTFVGFGWMVERPTFQGGPAGLELRAFAWTPDGRREVAAALDRTEVAPGGRAR